MKEAIHIANKHTGYVYCQKGAQLKYSSGKCKVKLKCDTKIYPPGRLILKTQKEIQGLAKMQGNSDAIHC